MGLALFAAMPVFAQQKATINVHPSKGKKSSVNIFTGNLQSIWAPVSMELVGR